MGALSNYQTVLSINLFGKSDGSVAIKVRVNPDLRKRINAGFRGKWINSENIGKSEEEIIALWNEAYPEDPVEV